MATSRTGTASHKRFRTAVLRRDRRAGIEQCPICGVTLDYSQGLRPNSAEPDHIVPHAHGGTDSADNGRTICRRCNQRRGNGQSKRALKREAAQGKRVTTLIAW